MRSNRCRPIADSADEKPGSPLAALSQLPSPRISEEPRAKGCPSTRFARTATAPWVPERPLRCPGSGFIDSDELMSLLKDLGHSYTVRGA